MYPTSQLLIIRGSDKRNIIFQLGLRDLVQDIFAACKSQKPLFFLNTSLTPLRNKISNALRLLKRKFSTTVKGCKSTIFRGSYCVRCSCRDEWGEAYMRSYNGQHEYDYSTDLGIQSVSDFKQHQSLLLRRPLAEANEEVSDACLLTRNKTPDVK